MFLFVFSVRLFFMFLQVCKRLTQFYTLLALVFNLFGVNFSENGFIMGDEYKKEGKDKWQLLNYLSGEAKMAIYISRKKRVENKGQDSRTVWLCNIRARLWLEYTFYKNIGDLDTFKNRWCYKNIVCSSVDLLFVHIFKR